MKHIAQSICKIAAEDTYELRHRILRPHLAEADSVLEGDHDQNALHLGAFLKKDIVGTLSFLPKENRNFETQPQFQLVGMAIKEQFRNQKLGESLLLHGEQILHEKYDRLLVWIHARESAIDFYKKYKYESLGRPFEIPQVCLAILMYKTLF